MRREENEEEQGSIGRRSRAIINGAIQFTWAHVLQLVPIIVLLTANWVAQSNGIERNRSEIEEMRQEVKEAVLELTNSRNSHNVAIIQLNDRLDAELRLMSERLNYIIQRMTVDFDRRPPLLPDPRSNGGSNTFPPSPR